LRVVDVKDVVLWLLATMMESASNTTTERSAIFAFKVFYF
jgi:hypothetical protein